LRSIPAATTVTYSGTAPAGPADPGYDEHVFGRV
jgi:hypothetical protein